MLRSIVLVALYDLAAQAYAEEIYESRGAAGMLKDRLVDRALRQSLFDQGGLDRSVVSKSSTAKLDTQDESSCSGTLWMGYLAVLLFSVTLQVISVAALLYVWGRALWRRARKDVSESRTPTPERVAVIVPCYLPNEASIIQANIRHLLDNMTGLERLDIYLAYNTPRDMPSLEGELAAMAEGPLPEGRRLIVQRVHGSRSKAENLNYLVPQIRPEDTGFVAVYDADHQPDSASLALAVEYLKNSGVDCVQGSTYIREGCCALKNLVCAEFFVTYFVLLPIMQAISGTGFFGGANAVWATTALQRVHFDTQALTEDIDCFARAVMQQQLTFAFLPESCSGELLPASLKGFWRQRLRWAMGWDQVTIRHAPKFWASGLPLRKRLGLYYIFVFRWFSQFCGVIIVLVNIGTFLTAFSTLQEEPYCVSAMKQVSFGISIVMLGCTVVRALCHQPCGIGLFLGLSMYFLVMPFYVLFGSVLLMVSLTRIATGNTGEWVVTVRSGAPSGSTCMAPGAALAPLLIGERAQKNAWLFLAIGFLATGSALGAFVGYILGQRSVTTWSWGGYWGWVPLPFSTHVIYVTDGRVVAEGILGGLAASLFPALVLWLWQQKQNRR